MTEYSWIRNRRVIIDGIEHIVSHRRDNDKSFFETFIIKVHPTHPEIMCSYKSHNKEIMYNQLDNMIQSITKNDYKLGEYIE